MSGYILCQTKKADKPFFVESINTNIYSLEELCYFLYHNLYLVDSSIINEIINNNNKQNEIISCRGGHCRR